MSPFFIQKGKLLWRVPHLVVGDFSFLSRDYNILIVWNKITIKNTGLNLVLKWIAERKNVAEPGRLGTQERKLQFKKKKWLLFWS